MLQSIFIIFFFSPRSIHVLELLCIILCYCQCRFVLLKLTPVTMHLLYQMKKQKTKNFAEKWYKTRIDSVIERENERANKSAPSAHYYCWLILIILHSAENNLDLLFELRDFQCNAQTDKCAIVARICL